MNPVKNVYTACACNTTPHSLDWGRNGLMIYAACNAVAIFNPMCGESGKVESTFSYHQGRINCVKWIKQEDGSPEKELISASVDGSAIVWTLKDAAYYPSAVLAEHTRSVTIADGMYISGSVKKEQRNEFQAFSEACKNENTFKPMILATASVDSTVKLWMRQENKEHFSCIQTLNFGMGFCLHVCLHYLPGSANVLVACARDNSKVCLYSDNGGAFEEVHVLGGHEDWVRTIDMVTEDSGDVLIATGSQDTIIRLWRLFIYHHERERNDLLINKTKFTVGNQTYSMILEAVLVGHEGLIYGVNWHPAEYADGCKVHQPMELLSSSLDQTMIIWKPHVSSEVWLDSVRVGDNVNSISATTSGFFGCKFGPSGSSFVGHGFQGSFHVWSHNKDKNIWQPSKPLGGHFDDVVDLQWEPQGRFLLTVSKDKTTRIHVPWILHDSEGIITWHEIARPQVHGHDMKCIAVLSEFQFVSGAEEKLVRAFRAPSSFRKNLMKFCNLSTVDVADAPDLPRSASVAALGLSNKALYNNDITDHVMTDEFFSPPTEEELVSSTLWPEEKKLYGHGYELFALAAHRNGKLFASACRASTPEHASIILWNTETWVQHQILRSHHLTVTQMAFSPDGQYLLSVSRDRRWSLFHCDEDGMYKLITATDKSNGVHTRIIWTCAWSHDSLYFATGSRDGKVVIWDAYEGPPRGSPALDLGGKSVTALAFASQFVLGSYLLAVGLECGTILLCIWHSSSKLWEKRLELNNDIAHHMTVNRLQFRPTDAATLASCGADHIVKIHQLDFSML